MKRRKFIQSCMTAGFGVAAVGMHHTLLWAKKTDMFFKISLAQWSLHRMLFDKKLTNLDFPQKTKEDFDIDAVEYVSVFFEGKETDEYYLKELVKRTNDWGVKNLLIMVDREGYLGDLDKKKRNIAVKNHHKWIDAAKYIGCHSIRVNAHGEGTYDEVKQAAIEGLGKLTTYGEKHNINVIVENHGGYSSNGRWLTEVIKQVGNPYCGTLPDFGNFYDYDRYKGVKEMMPFAKGVSAKSHDFDTQGNETKIDYEQMLRIVKKSGYNGYIGIEYEGSAMSEKEGVRKTKALLEKFGRTV